MIAVNRHGDTLTGAADVDAASILWSILLGPLRGDHSTLSDAPSVNPYDRPDGHRGATQSVPARDLCRVAHEAHSRGPGRVLMAVRASYGFTVWRRTELNGLHGGAKVSTKSIDGGINIRRP